VTARFRAENDIGRRKAMARYTGQPVKNLAQELGVNIVAAFPE
jgi:hypothetical protein